MWRILVVIGVLSVIPRPALLASPCLEYERVSLSGTLVRQIYPGPPDYESVTKGDEALTIWVLLLDKRICVAASSSRYSRQYEREIQLVSAGNQYARYRNLIGEKIIVTGNLRPGGAWDEKRLVLAENEVRRASRHP